MVGIVVINVPFRREGGILGTWYVVCLISLKSLVQILRACDIDYSQSREWGLQGCLGHFQEGQKG